MVSSPRTRPRSHTTWWDGSRRANNLYAETTFVCPAYWIADAYSSGINGNAGGKSAWHYQFSVTDAFHGADLSPLTGDTATQGTKMNQAFRKSFQSIWSQFIIHGDPTLGPAAGGAGGNVSAAATGSWKT